MTRTALLAVAVALAGCSTSPPPATPAPRQATTTTTASSGATAPSMTGTDGRPITQADVHFMSGMIGHHAQAIVMAGWAPIARRQPVGPDAGGADHQRASRTRSHHAARGSAIAASRCPRPTPMAMKMIDERRWSTRC